MVDPKKLKYRNLTVSGLPGAGSSTLGKGLKKVLRWKYFSGGDFMRAYAIKRGLFDPRNTLHHDATVYGADFDRQVDLGMREALEKEKGQILDSWLSGFVAQGVEGVLKILVCCDNDAVRVDRIVNRDKISVEEAKQHIFERERRNVDKWRQVYVKEWHEWIVERGVLSKGAEIDFWEPKLYDLVIDTYSHSLEETLKRALRKLGYVGEVET
jgi:cytidylate kinase